MAMVDRREYIQKRKDELFFLVGILEGIYGGTNKLNQSVKRWAVLSSNMSELKKNPDKALSVFMPVILSYGKENTGLDRLYNGERSCFKDAVDALLKYGVDRFYLELRKVK